MPREDLENDMHSPMKPKIGRFLINFSLCLVPPVSVVLATIIIVASFAPEDFVRSRFTLVYSIVVWPVVILVFCAVLAWIGTSLPAAAIGADSSLRLAAQRGLRSFWRTMGRLVIGNFVVWLIAFLLVDRLFMLISTHLSDNLHIAFLFILASLSQLILSFPAMLTACALCMAYIEEGGET
ncbi:MAG: hypothetical protein MK098_00840 [Marinovum sp.]|nr:hypothetical protein [Marinovum sp.]